MLTSFRRSVIRIVPVAAIVFATGCATTVPQRTFPEAVPDSFGSTEAVDTHWVRDTGWWNELNDPALNSLISNTLSGNLDLQAGWSRIKQTEALARQSGASRWPSVTASGSAGRSRTYSAAGQMTTNQYSLSLGAQYELDLWGRLADTEAAAVRDVRAARFDIETLGMTLSATVADLWYQLVAQRQQQTLLTRQIAADSVYLELIEARFATGLATAVDVYQQRQQLAGTRAELPSIEAQISLLENQLAVLTGNAPRQVEIASSGSFPTLSELPTVGVPTDLVQNRPDVQAAFERLAASDHRVAAAASARYPSLSFSASTGFGATSFSDLLDQWVWSIASSLVMPIVDGGQRSAALDQQKAVVEERLIGVRSVLLISFQEVEDALIQERHQRDYLSELDLQLEISRRLLTETRNRYAQGLSEYLPVLTAIQTLNRIERTRLSAQRQLISYRIQLYRALGGSWTTQLGPTGMAGIQGDDHNEQ